jgi:integral membrane sensor domain MASE1
VTYALAAGVYTILSWLGVIALPVGIVSVSALFVAIGFGIPFAIWFGGWGLLIGYIGTLLGAGILGGTPVLLAIPFGLVDVIQFGVPLIAYRLLAPRIGLHPLGRDVYTLKGLAFFCLFGALVPNGLGALYGISILSLGNLVPPAAFWPGVIAWWLGNVVVSLVVAPVLMRVITPVIERLGLATYGIVT